MVQSAAEAINIGTGIGSAMGWKDIDVHRKPSGEPFVVLEGGAKKLGEERNIIAVWITLSHTEHHAVAMIVIESEGGSGGRASLAPSTLE